MARGGVARLLAVGVVVVAAAGNRSKGGDWGGKKWQREMIATKDWKAAYFDPSLKLTRVGSLHNVTDMFRPSLFRNVAGHSWEANERLVTGAGHEWCTLTRSNWVCFGDHYADVLRKTEPYDASAFQPGQESGDSMSLQCGCSRSNARGKKHPRFGPAPRDDRSSKNKPNRVENDRERRF